MFYEVNVNVSATVDHISWDCPECYVHNETNSYLDTCCKNCGYDIANDADIPCDLDDIITGYHEEEEEEEN